MSKYENNFELLLRYTEGTASAEELRSVEQLLSDDAEARFLLRQIAEHAVVSADVERLSQGDRGRASVAIPTKRGVSNPARRSWMVAAAAIIFCLIWASWFQESPGQEQECITVIAVNGPCEWTGNGGHVTNSFGVGEKLPGGTLELLAPDSRVEFAFLDDSRVALAGLSEVTISSGTDLTKGPQQKRMHLKHGRLAAVVREQPQGLPMLVRTTSAELIVVGTQFDVEAASSSTSLTVQKGKVRLKRLLDGREVAVLAQQTAQASLDDQGQLLANRRSAPVSVWQSDLHEDVVCGKWVSELWALGAKLKKAVRSGEMTKEAAGEAFRGAASLGTASGSVWAVPSPVGAIVVLSPKASSIQPVLLNAKSTIRIKMQLHSKVALRIGLTVRGPSGGFAGKFSTQISAETLAAEGSVVELELPVSRFQDPLKPAESPAGKELKDWWCVADSSSAKVQIQSVRIVD